MQTNKNFIRKIVKTLKKKYFPEKIILFGSYAYGKTTKDSDIDLLIIKNTKKKRVDRFVEVKRIVYPLKIKTPFSPLVLTSKELKERIKNGDDFLEEVITKGEVLYER